jgi:hypothetical protein
VLIDPSRGATSRHGPPAPRPPVIVQNRVGALVVAGDSCLASRREQIIALAARNAIPTICVNREMAVAGGLMSLRKQPSGCLSPLPRIGCL